MNDKNPYINIMGKNTLIAIIDSGIDYLHPDFIDENKKSKILTITIILMVLSLILA